MSEQDWKTDPRVSWMKPGTAVWVECPNRKSLRPGRINSGPQIGTHGWVVFVRWREQEFDEWRTSKFFHDRVTCRESWQTWQTCCAFIAEQFGIELSSNPDEFKEALVEAFGERIVRDGSELIDRKTWFEAQVYSPEVGDHVEMEFCAFVGLGMEELTPEDWTQYGVKVDAEGRVLEVEE